MNENYQKVYEYIKIEPRSCKTILEQFNEFSERYIYKILKLLLKKGMILKKVLDNKSIYYVSSNSKFEILETLYELIRSFDKHGSRIYKIANNVENFDVKDLVVTEDITASVKSLTSNEYYSTKISENDYYCSCMGYMYNMLPCVHVLILVILNNKINWVTEWIGDIVGFDGK